MHTPIDSVESLTSRIQTLNNTSASKICRIECKDQFWDFSSDSICKVSAPLEALHRVAFKKGDVSIIYFRPMYLSVVQILVKFLQSPNACSDIIPDCPSKVQTLMHCADVHMFAARLKIYQLAGLALDRWTAITNTCIFGTLSITDMFDLFRHIFSVTSEHANDIRLQAIRFAAEYQQRWYNLRDSYLEAYLQEKDFWDKAAIEFRNGFWIMYCRRVREFEDFMSSEEPLAWPMAKMYEADKRMMSDLDD